MKFLILLVFSLLFRISFSQNFYLKKEDKSISKNNFVTVVNITKDAVKVKVYFETPQRCACEKYEVFTLTKKGSGYYSVHPYRDNGKMIKAKVENGKVIHIVIEDDLPGFCCSFWPGTYVSRSN